MATRFVTVDRYTPMLLPPDLRDWVPPDDMVHFVIEAVEGLRLSTLKVNRRGSGSAQYPPKMMMALLVYCYANGVFSSRRIERATHRDVAVRYLTGDTHPDHDTICTFRRENAEAVGEVFLQILLLAKEMGVLKVGTVSVDGTHIQANASKDKNVRYDRAVELEAKLSADIEALMAQAETTDHREEDDGQSLPKRIAHRQKLHKRMQEARKELESRAKAQARQEQPEYEKKVRDRDNRPGSRKGRHIKPPSQTPAPTAQVNLTDADSRLMRKNKRSSYTQSYNAQATVDADGSQLIVGQHVTTCASDSNELEPALASVPSEVGRPSAVLADAGYVNADQWKRVTHGEAQDGEDAGGDGRGGGGSGETGGPELYISVCREDAHSERRYDYRPAAERDKPAKKITNPTLLAMKAKLETDEGRAMYAKRKQTVEPVFGIIKQILGFRQFLRRGVEAVRAEWTLVCLAYNAKRLWNLKNA